ncbi:hypothetical protein [Chitinilyticum aquatile]|uniref:hypothetical protein n=1 Tax=Chitinilyticum aquatile TaxID=362520 RepID=UPI0004269784|nr:hypothetical protein [Chitinilyticum aquatile]
MTRPALLVVSQPDTGALLAARWAKHPPAADYTLCTPDTLPARSNAGAILLVQQPLAMALGMAAACPVACADLALQASPAGIEYGFMLAAGGSSAALAHLAPLLDSLAPMPDAWLHAGPTGAASFCSEAVTLLSGAGLAPLLMSITRQIITSPPTGTPDQHALLGALGQYLQAQSDSCSQLRILAAQYLASSPETEAAFTPHHPQTRQFGFLPLDAELAPATQLARLLLQSLPAGPA